MKKAFLLAAALLLMAPMGAKAQQCVQNYVSASGYVIFNAPFCNTGTDGYAFDFENDYVEGQLVNWTTIDADGIHDYVTVTTDGIEELSTENKVYPNPTHGQVTIEADGISRVTVMNALGQIVYDAPAEASQTVLDLSEHGTGMYLIRISSENGTYVKRVSVVK